MFRRSGKKFRSRNRRGRKHEREFIGAGCLIERQEIGFAASVSRESKVDAASNFIGLKSRSPTGMCCEKDCRRVIRSGTNQIEVSTLVRRKMKLQRFAGF